jgi:dethiobiotin synthetase
MNAYFISGSDTEVGKTWVTRRLLTHLRELGLTPCGFKPIACGDRGDALNFMDAAPVPGLTLDDVNPWFHQPPLAPYAAAVVEERPVDWAVVDRAFERVCSVANPVLVEGAGGIMTPLSATDTMRDIAARWSLPVILVVANRLGALSQALASAECVRSGGLTLAALVLNDLGVPPAESDPCGTTVAQSNLAILEERFPGKVFTSANESLSALAKRLKRE